ncbi:MAG: metal ABC transporter permease [Verrucomicrobiae bacterium]|nr:metal ABC transporter permease [Verrucomicrobiae bacterium]
MIQTLREILAPEFLLHNSVVASLLVGFVCPLVGMFFVLRRAVLLGVALPQVSSAGVALAFWLHALGIHVLGHDETERGTALVGSTAFTAVALAALALSERRGSGPVEGRTGAVYAVAAALAVLFTARNPSGESHVTSLLKGEIVAVADADLRLLAVVYAAVILLVAVFRRQLVLVSFDRNMAETLMRRPWGWDLMLYGVFGLTISIGVMIVGPLTLFGFLVLPVLAVRPWASGLFSLAIASSLLGGVTALAGFALAYRADLPVGPTDVAVAFAVYVASAGARQVARS